MYSQNKSNKLLVSNSRAVKFVSASSSEFTSLLKDSVEPSEKGVIWGDKTLSELIRDLCKTEQSSEEIDATKCIKYLSEAVAVVRDLGPDFQAFPICLAYGRFKKSIEVIQIALETNELDQLTKSKIMNLLNRMTAN